jgi:hypothetical protein
MRRSSAETILIGLLALFVILFAAGYAWVYMRIENPEAAAVAVETSTETEALPPGATGAPGGMPTTPGAAPGAPSSPTATPASPSGM